MSKRICLGLLLIFVTSCGHKVQPKVMAPPPLMSGPAEHEIAYREGLKAFRLATPEGYQRAAVLFGQASELEPASCEYALHLTEALLFLAQQQKSNWDDYAPSTDAANAILDRRSFSHECNAFESYVSRLRSISLTVAGARTAESVAMIRHAIEIDPQDVMNWVVLSQLDRLTRRGESKSPIQQAVDLDPGLPLVQYELGNTYLLDATTYGKAKESFQRALELSPRHFQSIFGVVYSLSVEGDDAAAQMESLLKSAVEIAPASLKARTLLGDYYAGLEETEKAVEQYDAAIGRNNRYYPAHLARGTALVSANRLDDAEKSFEAVIALDVKRPQPPYNAVDFAADGQARYHLGNIWLERGDLVKARAEYSESVKDVANYAPAIYGLGIVSYKEGRADEALRHLDQVIQQNPRQFPNAYFVRGGIRAERRQYTESLRDINLAIEIYQQQAVSLEGKAQADEARGWKRRAESERRRKALIETTLEKAMESRKTVQTLASRG